MGFISYFKIIQGTSIDPHFQICSQIWPFFNIYKFDHGYFEYFTPYCTLHGHFEYFMPYCTPIPIVWTIIQVKKKWVMQWQAECDQTNKIYVDQLKKFW